ncbi:MAG: hypothetical protein WBG46_14280 [Nonlabens sp.]
MISITRKITIILLILCGFNTEAQNQNNEKQKCNCCDAPYTNFDFWEGDWIVKNKNGEIVGENTITKKENNCMLEEKWRGSKGSSGTSINFYNKADDTWNQTWVSNSGNFLQLKGKIIGNKMVLKSELIQGKKGKYYNQISWSPNKDGTVTQLWEIFTESGKPIQNIFKGIYHRKQ